MHKIMIALTGVAILTLSGCASTTPEKIAAPQAAPAKTEAVAETQLTNEAKQALAKAESDVQAAKAKKALWTNAADELKNARTAAEKNDSPAVIKHAKAASEFAQLGIAQTDYPMSKISK